MYHPMLQRRRGKKRGIYLNVFNWSFAAQGLIDELSLVISPVAEKVDGCKTTRYNGLHMRVTVAIHSF